MLKNQNVLKKKTIKKLLVSFLLNNMIKLKHKICVVLVSLSLIKKQIYDRFIIPASQEISQWVNPV